VVGCCFCGWNRNEEVNGYNVEKGKERKNVPFKGADVTLSQSTCRRGLCTCTVRSARISSLEIDVLYLYTIFLYVV
jgi:hypothetical protein